MFTISRQFIHSLLITGTISLVTSFVFLYIVKRSSDNFFSFLNVYSPKSPTQAKLLGGMGISAGIITSMFSLLTREHMMIRFEESFIYAMIFSTISITIYGYVDDKYETRARHKIIFQLISLSFLTFYAADLLASPNHKVAAIIVATVLGFLLINGANLLDGLDTLSIKLGTITSLGFIYLGYHTESLLCIQLSVATIAALSAFYYFNRAPAKIYMGEIGSCLLGLVYTAQIVLCYSHLRTEQLGLDAISTVLIVVSLPICELGVSFLRRIYFGKTPFSGDKLHFHYILKSKAHLSVSATTTLMALGSIAIIAIGYLVMAYVTPFMGLVTTNLLFCGVYVGFCYKDWVKNQSALHKVSIMAHLKAESVYLITTSDLEKVSVRLIVEEVPKKSTAKEAA